MTPALYNSHRTASTWKINIKTFCLLHLMYVHLCHSSSVWESILHFAVTYTLVCVCVIARPHTAEQRRERLTACYVKCTESFQTSVINPSKTKDWQTSAPERLIKAKIYMFFFFFKHSAEDACSPAADGRHTSPERGIHSSTIKQGTFTLLLCMKIFITAHCSCNTYVNSSKLTQSSNIWSMYLDIKR